MITCACGGESPGEARFCCQCGDLLTDGLVDLGDSFQRGAEQSERIAKNSVGPQRFGALVGLVVVGLIAWSVWSLATSNEAPDSPSSSTPTARQSESSVALTTAVEGEDDESGRSSVPEIEIVVPVDLAVDPDEVFDFDLLLVNGGRRTVLNLGSGQIQDFEGSEVQALAVTGQWLLVRDIKGRAAVLALDDLAGSPRELSPEVGAWFEVVDRGQRSDGTVWLRLYDGNEAGREVAELVRVDVASGEIVESALTPEQLSLGYSDQTFLSEGPVLLSDRSGGVYELMGEGFVLVADGRLVAADVQRALVETCDQRLRCESHWFDRHSWEPVDLGLPPERIRNGGFVNRTDWLLLVDSEAFQGYRLFNVVTSQLVEVDDPIFHFLNLAGLVPAISPDGRWLAPVLNPPNTIRLIELSTGAEITIRGFQDVFGPVLFLDQSPRP